MPKRTLLEAIASDEPTLFITTACGARLPAHRELLRLHSSCVKGLPPGGDTWDLSGLLIEGAPVSRAVVTAWLEVLYESCSYNDGEGLESQRHREREQRLEAQRRRQQQRQQLLQARIEPPGNGTSSVAGGADACGAGGADAGGAGSAIAVAAAGSGPGAAAAEAVDASDPGSHAVALLLFADAVGSSEGLFSTCCDRKESWLSSLCVMAGGAHLTLSLTATYTLRACVGANAATSCKLCWEESYGKGSKVIPVPVAQAEREIQWQAAAQAEQRLYVAHRLDLGYLHGQVNKFCGRHPSVLPRKLLKSAVYTPRVMAAIGEQTLHAVYIDQKCRDSRKRPLSPQAPSLANTDSAGGSASGDDDSEGGGGFGSDGHAD